MPPRQLRSFLPRVPRHSAVLKQATPIRPSGLCADKKGRQFGDSGALSADATECQSEHVVTDGDIRPTRTGRLVNLGEL